MYEIDGITYNDETPHSRIEKELLDILDKMEDKSDSDDNP